MTRTTALRTLARCRRLLFAIYALPAGTLRPNSMTLSRTCVPGYPERVMAAYLASLPTAEQQH